MFGSTIWNAGATLRQYSCRATGVPAPDCAGFTQRGALEKYFKKGLKSRPRLPIHSEGGAMDRTLATLSGSSHIALIDHDIAHIARVMRMALHGDLGGPILPAAYWRKRLYELLDTGNLSHQQLCAIDSLLLQLGQFEADPPPAWDSMAPATASLFPPPYSPSASSAV
jgi:hypothetical protein